MSTTDVTDCDCVLPGRDPASGKFVGFFRPRTQPKRRFIGLSESDNFEHWTYPRMILTPDANDDLIPLMNAYGAYLFDKDGKIDFQRKEIIEVLN